jgi:HAD superfamily hydrolase (TIGR01490 family)
MKNDDDRPAIAIFDLDRTITKYDTYSRYLLGFLKRQPFRLFSTYSLPWVAIQFKLGLVDNTYVKLHFLQKILAGNNRKVIDTWTAIFIENLLNKGLYKKAVERINHHRTRGDRLVLATASFDFYVIPLAACLGFDDVVCTRSVWDNFDHLSPSLSGMNCYGEAKLFYLKEHLGSLLSDTHIIAYSDHHSDLPLLKWSHQAVAVNPTRQLSNIASNYGFTVEDWSREE